MTTHLHIVSLTVPYPVDYGGVFDLFYKLPALQQQDARIHLHCFDYGRGQQEQLNRYCTSVHYYERRRAGLFTGLPHIVASRANDALVNRLLEDEHPILMEGIHCTWLLNDKRFLGRKLYVRLHNVESEYYTDLFKATSHPLKKLYFKREAALLERYEKMVADKATFLPVSERDLTIYQSKFNCRDIVHIPLFLPPWSVNTMEGVGSYCLYHGDLSVSSNLRMVKWLVTEIFNDIKVPLKIAGKAPPPSLKRLLSRSENISLVADPDENVMHQLIGGAHINLVPSFSPSGIKVKLLNALFNGRHCLVNRATVDRTGLEPLCHIADNADHLKNMISQLYHQPFRKDESDNRKEILESKFDNPANAKKLVSLINN